ncbi:helix-turn-helix domain-containing protein [Geminicoccus flavidas]|uniref:helix-turn-helix domain-containing protein n=1 Tax=Geminicoccus flavidas TaxID=2506407 RepID=UPI0013599650|nr:helix-turn-helix domain-containing protein [Geminicoccus flavidas]
MSIEAAELDRRIGARLRNLRSESGLTLDDLAARAGVSRSMLSRIELGQSSPTAQLLARICGGLGITLSMLFAGSEAAGNPVCRRADQPVWRDPETGYQRRAVSPAGTGSPVDIVEIEFAPGGSVTFAGLPLAGIDQHVWVLEGRLELRQGDELTLLETGDCLMMRFGPPASFRNPDDRPLRYLLVTGRSVLQPRQEPLR